MGKKNWDEGRKNECEINKKKENLPIMFGFFFLYHQELFEPCCLSELFQEEDEPKPLLPQLFP